VTKLHRQGSRKMLRDLFPITRRLVAVLSTILIFLLPAQFFISLEAEKDHSLVIYLRYKLSIQTSFDKPSKVGGSIAFWSFIQDAFIEHLLV
jgi:hypothetical protein